MELKELVKQLAASGQPLTVKVTPKASANALTLDRQENGDGWLLKARLTVVPEKGKANAALLKLLAKEAGIAKTAITIVSGETSRTKIIRFD